MSDEAHLFAVSESQVCATTNDEWYTPGWIFDAAALTFDLDVSAPVNPALRGVPAHRHLTVLDDGLSAPWGDGSVWCNPPYSGTGPWVDRWASHTGQGMLLVPAVKARWVGTVMRAAEAVTLLRVDFNRPGGEVGETRWLSLLAGKGPDCVAAVGRVARRDVGAARGSYFIRGAA